MSPQVFTGACRFDGLADGHREILQLNEVRGLGAADLGRALGLTTPEARVALHAARQSLRAQLCRWMSPSATAALKMRAV